MHTKSKIHVSQRDPFTKTTWIWIYFWPQIPFYLCIPWWYKMVVTIYTKCLFITWYQYHAGYFKQDFVCTSNLVRQNLIVWKLLQQQDHPPGLMAGTEPKFTGESSVLLLLLITTTTSKSILGNYANHYNTLQNRFQHWHIGSKNVVIMRFLVVIEGW